MGSFSQKLIDGLREPVSAAIEHLEAKLGGEVPTREIFIVNDDGTIGRKEIADFRNLPIQFDDSFTPVVEAAEWMVESDAISNREFQYVDSEDPEEYVDGYVDAIHSLTKDTINRVGTFDFQDSAYEDSFENWFRIVFGRPAKFISFQPLSNFTGSFDNLELEPRLPFGDEYPDDRVTSIQIKKVEDQELASIYTSERDETIRGMPRFSDWEYLIRVEADGTWPEPIFDDVGEMVITTLRLLNPSQPDIGPGPRYYMWKNDMYERAGIFDPIGWRSNEYKLPSSNTKYTLYEEDGDPLKRFWEHHRHQLYTGNRDSLRTILSEPLRRFNFMYRRSIPEDQILDCVIGLEGSLAKDIRGGYAVYFPFRAATLLCGEEEHSSIFIYEFFSELYSTRNRIVHQTGQVESVEISGSDVDTGQFTRLARYFLAQLLKEYAKFDNDGLNITQTNTEIIDPVLPELIADLPNSRLSR